jgi:hypothetical protein
VTSGGKARNAFSRPGVRIDTVEDPPAVDTARVLDDRNDKVRQMYPYAAQRCLVALTSVIIMHGLVPDALAEADGPDFYAVTGVAADDVLNIRAEPSARSEKLGEIPHDARGLENLGCLGLPSFVEWQAMTGQQRQASRKDYWCRVKYQELAGWVAGRYLREDSTPE